MHAHAAIPLHVASLHVALPPSPPHPSRVACPYCVGGVEKGRELPALCICAVRLACFILLGGSWCVPHVSRWHVHVRRAPYVDAHGETDNGLVRMCSAPAAITPPPPPMCCAAPFLLHGRHCRHSASSSAFCLPTLHARSRLSSCVCVHCPGLNGAITAAGPTAVPKHGYVRRAAQGVAAARHPSHAGP